MREVRQRSQAFSVRRLGDSTIAAAGALLALMLASIAVVRGGILFNAPLWLDEYHTLFMTERGSLLQSMRDLAGGGDYAPPVLHFGERFVSLLAGGTSVLSLRLTCFIAVWMALVLIFCALRRVVSPSAAFVGAFSVWANTFIVEFGFEARPYGPWVFCCTFVIWSLGLHVENERSRSRDVALAISSALLCTIHYFGIISLGLIAFGAAVWIARTRRTYRRLLPMIAGPVALALCMPLYIGQQRTLTVKTWISALNAHQVREMLETYLLTWPFVCAFLMLLALVFQNTIRRQAVSRGTMISTLPFLMMLLLPAMLVLGSATVQPMMQLRYALPAAIAVAPVVAFAAQSWGRLGKVVLLTVSFLFSVRALDARSHALANFQALVETEAAMVKPFLDSGYIVVNPSRSSVYPLATATARPSQLAFADYTDSLARLRRLPRTLVMDRDCARAHTHVYGFPILQSIDVRASGGELLFFLPLYGTAYTLSVLFPDDHIIRQVAPRVYRIRRADGTSPAYVDPVYRAMKLMYQDRNPAAAIAVVDSVLARDGGHYGALWQRAAALEMLNRKREAALAWRIAISEAEQNGWRDGFRQAKQRLTALECAGYSDQSTLSAKLMRIYRCRS